MPVPGSACAGCSVESEPPSLLVEGRSATGEDGSEGAANSGGGSVAGDEARSEVRITCPGLEPDLTGWVASCILRFFFFTFFFVALTGWVAAFGAFFLFFFARGSRPRPVCPFVLNPKHPWVLRFDLASSTLLWQAYSFLRPHRLHDSVTGTRALTTTSTSDESKSGPNPTSPLTGAGATGSVGVLWCCCSGYHYGHILPFRLLLLGREGRTWNVGTNSSSVCSFAI